MFPIDALNASVVEMDNIRLNCYAENAKDVTWLHNNKSILLYKLGGSMNLSKDYEGRASLENNCFKTGDLSLTIARVRKEDTGIYRCFVGDSTTKGNPHAYVLHVNGIRLGIVGLNITCHFTIVNIVNNLVHFPK